MRELLIKVATNLAAKGISVVLALLMQIMLARWLSTYEYGQFALMQVIALGFATFAQAGMQDVYMKLISELDELYGFTQVSRICLGLVAKHLWVALVGYIFVCAVLALNEKITSLKVLVAFGIYLVMQTYMLLLLAYFRAVNKAYVASFLEQGSFAGLTVVFGLLWLWFSAEPIDFELAATAYAVAIFIMVVFFLTPVIAQYRSHLKDEVTVDVVRFKQMSNRFLTMQMASFATNWAGIIFVGILLAADQVAELNVAQRFAQMIVFFLIAFNGVIAPRFAKLNAKGDSAGLKKLAQRAATLLVLATVPIVLLCIFFGKQLLSIFGSEYGTAYPLLLIVLVGQLINALTGSVGFLLNMTNHEQIMRNIVLTTGVISIIVSPVTTYFFGVMGAAIAVTAGLAINNLTAAYFVYKYLGFVTVPGLQWIKKNAY